MTIKKGACSVLNQKEASEKQYQCRFLSSFPKESHMRIIVLIVASLFSMAVSAYEACSSILPSVPCTMNNHDMNTLMMGTWWWGGEKQVVFYDSASYVVNNSVNSNPDVNDIVNTSNIHCDGYVVSFGCFGTASVYNKAIDFVWIGTGTPEPRYPIGYTPANPNGWHHKAQSFGSLNNTSGVTHAAEDWNLNTGTCTDIGKPLVSITDGVVADINLGNGSDGWGKTILIRHDAPAGKYFLTGTGQLLSTAYSLYAHMLKSGQDASYSQSLDIQQGIGQPIKKGDPVGQVGTGDGQYAGACHLHFAILTDGAYVQGYRMNPYSWSSMAYFANPSELIDNGLYPSQSTAPFTIIVHPYECSGAFKLNNGAPSCNPTSATIGNWTRRGGSFNPGGYELGYGGIIYSKPANKAGTVVWTPNLPRDGQYRVSVYIPDSSTYATSTRTSYCVVQNGICGSPVTINQASTSARGKWTSLGTYSLYRSALPQVTLNGNTGESGKTVAVDVVKFEYIGLVQ